MPLAGDCVSAGTVLVTPAKMVLEFQICWLFKSKLSIIKTRPTSPSKVIGFIDFNVLRRAFLALMSSFLEGKSKKNLL